MAKKSKFQPSGEFQPSTFYEYRSRSRLLQCVYVKHGPLSIYLRNCLNGRSDFVIANVKSDKPGSGSLRRFLDDFEPHFSFMFETVLNRRLEKFLKARGYEPHGDPFCPHLELPDPVHHSIWIKTSSGFIRNPLYVHEMLPCEQQPDADPVPEQNEPVQENRSAEVHKLDFPDTPDGRARRRRAERQTGVQAV